MVRLHLIGWLVLGWVVQWCGPAARPAASSLHTPTTPALPAPTKATQAAPVAQLLQQLLDTTAAGSARAADARQGLQAGPEVRAFFGAACAPAWTTPADDSLQPASTAALRQLARAAEHGLRPDDYAVPRLRALRDSLRQPAPAERRAGQQARLELYLTDAALRFMRDLHRGRLRPYTWSAAEKVAGRPWAPAPLLRAALTQGAQQLPPVLVAGQPQHREYRQLQQALARWLAQPVPPDSAAWHQRQYQQAALNLERWRWHTLPPDSEYLFINIPAYELLVVAHDSVQRRHRVIVGQPRTPTPTLSSRLTHFTLAPDWHVPRSIATKEILPRLKADPGYLARNTYTLYNARGQVLDPYQVNWRTVTAANFSYTIRQSAGCDNALGNIVFRFANPYSIYLHDTPMRQFFARPDRALSHGCIRLAEPMALAAYLLRREGRPVQLPSEAECARQPQPRSVPLRHPIALHVGYATCVADSRGQLRFLPDIYSRDEALRRGLFGPQQ